MGRSTHRTLPPRPRSPPAPPTAPPPRSRPRRPSRRPRARPRLRDLAPRPGPPALTLVSAPAGFGKTTLVADWFAGERTTAWLSLDQREDDPERSATSALPPRATRGPDRR